MLLFFVQVISTTPSLIDRWTCLMLFIWKGKQEDLKTMMLQLSKKCVCLFLPSNEGLDSSVGAEQVGGVRGGWSWSQEASGVTRLHHRPFGCFWRRHWHGVISFLSVVQFCGACVFLSSRWHVIGWRVFFFFPMWQLCSIWWRIMETVLKVS